MDSKSLFVYIFPLVFAGVMLGFVPALLVLVLMFISLFTLNRLEAVIALTLAFVPVLGVAFPHYGIGVPASIFCLVISLLLSIGDLGTILNKNRSPLLYIAFLWVIMIMYYFLTGHTDNSTNKIIVMSQLIVLNTLAFFMLSSEKDIRIEAIAPFLLCSGIFLIAAAHDYRGYLSFHCLFDFESFRVLSVEKMHGEESSISYHRVGVQFMFAMSFLLSAKQKLEIKSAILLFVCIWGALVSGARQAIMGEIIILAVWVALRGRHSFRVRNIVLSLIIIVILLVGLEALQLDLFSLFFNKDVGFQEGLNRDWTYPLYIIQNNLFTGVGFGNYENPFVAKEVYAHNLFLEILCELGLIGLLIVSFVFLTWFYQKRPNLLNKFSKESLSVLIVLPFFIRAMISEDLSHNFVLFIAVFTLFSNQPQKALKWKDLVIQ